jgi:hypothetical protein
VALKKHDMGGFCHSEDATLSRCCQFAAVEINSPDSSYYAASVQLAIWLAAGLEKTRQLREYAAAAAQEEEEREEMGLLPPYVGSVVHGHVWNLHLACKAADGSVYANHLSFGHIPFLQGN